jgi:hypothetical protein
LGHPVFRETELPQTGEEIGQGLARSRLGDPADIPAGHDHGEHLLLNGRRVLIAELVEGVQQRFVQIQVAKIHVRARLAREGTPFGGMRRDQSGFLTGGVYYLITKKISIFGIKTCSYELNQKIANEVIEPKYKI